MGIRRKLAIQYLRISGNVWRHAPGCFRSVRFGNHLHSLVLKVSDRKQDGCTLFLRNRAELELIRRLALKLKQNSRIDIAVFACSKGAEVYSIACRCDRPAKWHGMQCHLHKDKRSIRLAARSLSSELAVAALDI